MLRSLRLAGGGSSFHKPENKQDLLHLFMLVFTFVQAKADHISSTLLSLSPGKLASEQFQVIESTVARAKSRRDGAQLTDVLPCHISLIIHLPCSLTAAKLQAVSSVAALPCSGSLLANTGWVS